MKILVTGANGYLGQGVVKSLLNWRDDVIATDFKLNNISNKVCKKECDLFAVDNPYEYFECPDVVLHMAWRDGFVHYSDAHINDLSQHFLFLKKMADSGVKKIAVMGSMHEIGFFEGAINEHTPCNPTTPYGIGKNALRELTQMLCQQKNIVFQWLRGFYIVGNTSYGCSIFSKIVQAENKGEKFFPFTLGQNQYDFIDYPDFCNQVAATVNQNEEDGIVNICSGRPEKLADRVERFIKENNYHIKLEYGAFPDRPYDSKAVWGNPEKINKIMENL